MFWFRSRCPNCHTSFFVKYNETFKC
ncbi:MJ0042-type zinc finger domain-containing protein [Priestia flexa]